MALLPEDLDYDKVNYNDLDVKVDIVNEYGIPISIEFPSFIAVNENGDTQQVNTDPSDLFFIPSPVTPGQSATLRVEVTNEAEVLGIQPEEIRYSGRASINSGLTASDNFAADTSKISFLLQIEKPLTGTFTNVGIEDTVELDIADDIDEVEVTKAVLRANIVNGFPFDGFFQVYLLNDNMQITDSLLLNDQRQLLRAATVDANGDAVEPGIFNDDIEISHEKFEKLLETNNIIFKVVWQLSTT